ncbi:hypothetical protein [Bacillus taeanensis]|uniref:Uncharacterized protein n=1 Tax=Bacillus taeanensis TaxID=273032 RepID=A0A366XPX9_9BACI|nr:hypothetical protein [Bacillus taeanensis]RBW68420.1 hypothetical protein DS031_16490 [Bacillus taeanensis]
MLGGKKNRKFGCCGCGCFIFLLITMILIGGFMSFFVEENEQEKEGSYIGETEVQEENQDNDQSSSEDTIPCLGIKGNYSSSGEKIYHMPSGDFYHKTDPEAWFCTEEEAEAAGYRKSKQ